MNKKLSLESHFRDAALSRCITLSDAPARQVLESIAGEVSVAPGVLRVACGSADRMALLMEVAGLLPSARYLLEAGTVVLETPGYRPIEVSTCGARDFSPNPDSVTARRQLSKAMLAYNRCKVAMDLPGRQLVICDRKSYLDAKITLAGFGVMAEDVIGRQIGEVPALDWLIQEMVPVCYQKPGERIIKEFEHSPVPGVKCRYRAEARTISDEVMVSIETITPQPWLSKG